MNQSIHQKLLLIISYYCCRYNGNGRGNMVWNPDTGIFAYSSGCTVVLEDLGSGTQKHLTGHSEEISTLAMQHDCQVRHCIILISTYSMVLSTCLYLN